jgi:cobyrinic acid a,c-diamide synthase
MTNAILVGGMASGVGKTTFTTGLIAALRAKGRKVQPFKAGPDYLDPTYHSRAAGPNFPARNLDTWLLPETNLKELYLRACSQADIAIIEGVMGLYDGKNGQAESGSSASLAKLLGVPVLAVLDIGKTSRTAGALALGLQKFDPTLKLAGFLLNNAGSQTHYEWAKQAVEEATGLPVVGWLPKNKEWALPERHLGLLPASESMQTEELEAILKVLAAQITQTVDIELIEQLATLAEPPIIETEPLETDSSQTKFSLFPKVSITPHLRIGLAQDQAFGFYYQDNLDVLRAWGAELIPFSPIVDHTLPEQLDGLYIGGGFPEVFAAALAANTAMLEAIRQFARQNHPIYAECGGLMYLGRELIDFDQIRYPMLGLIPYSTAMQQRRVKIGYAEIVAASSNQPLLKPGERWRGHEFHWSQLQGEINPDHAAYLIPEQHNRAEGWFEQNILASYIHLHFGSNAQITPRLLEWFASFK